MSVAATTAERLGAYARPRPGVLLAGIVAASAAVRAVVALVRPAPTLLPDEYIYAELARSLADTGRPLVRGASAHFPALLQPLLTAPAWLVDDVGVSFRLVALLGAVVMSLAAVPVYLLARRLGVASGPALACAALALAVPDTVYASYVVAEPFAYPLALAAFTAGVAALARPDRRLQVAFLLLAGLSVFARAQFAVLPLCYAAAVVALGLREGALRRALREQALALAPLAIVVVAVLAAGPRRALGYYEGVLDFDVLSPDLARWTGLDAMVLAYAVGWTLVPGALLGIWLALRRPRTRAELAFGVLIVPVVLALLLEAAVYALGGDRVQERYFFYAAPLAAVAFALYASRGLPHRLAHGALAVGLVAVSSRLPLSGFSAAEGKTNSPVLYAVSWLESALGDVGLASLLVALGFAAGTLLLVLAIWRAGRAVVPLAFGLSLATCLALLAGAVAYDRESGELGRATVFAADPSFVDASGLANVALLQSPNGGRTFALGHLFWNRSVDRVLLLPQAEEVDAFVDTTVALGPDGTLLAAGKPVRGPLLVDAFGSTMRFRGADEVARSGAYRLLRPAGQPRLALYVRGRYYDGWLAPGGSIQLFPDAPGEGLAGRLSFRVTAPPKAPGELALEGQTVRLAAGTSRVVTIRVCAPGSWTTDFEGPPTASFDGRFVSVRTSEPVFVPDPAACTAGRSATRSL